MEKPKAAEKKEFKRPTMGKRIISEKQARLLSNKTIEPESFLDDPTIMEPSMDDSDRSRLPTNAEMMEAVRRNNAERAAEFKSMGRTGREVLGDLPPINFKMPARIDTSSSESEAESDKENDAVDESMGGIEQVEKKEKEKEADETTPVGQQRSIGLVGPSSSATPAETVVPTTPPARPNSGFRKPNLPAQRQREVPPRHSTPKMNVRPRDSFGAAFNNISIIAANNSMHAPPTRKSGETKRESTESRRGRTLDVASSIEEEVENEQNLAAVNGTFVIEEGVRQKETMEEENEEEEEEEEEEEVVHVRVDAVVMRREPLVTREVSVEGGKERRERVEVVNVSMKRLSVPAALPPQDVSMVSIEEEEEGEEGGRGGTRDESIQMEDVEMDSVNETPVRNRWKRVPKRPSLEHAVTVDSSPMAVAMARRSGGLRETMVRPKVSVSSTATGRKISTGSVASSIPFEDISQNMSLMSSDRSYEEAKTPDRTPRTTRLLRQSLAAREMRQSQQQRLAIVEEAEMQGGEREEDEEDDEEEEKEGGGARRFSVMGTALSHSPATPVNRVPRLSQKLQSSVDRLSQPRNRHSPARPCSRMISPARAPPLRGGRFPLQPSPSPARKLHSFNETKATSGYTPNQRFDTTLMEDEEGARSGMAPRIRRIPRREEGKKVGPPVLNVSVDQSDIEQERKEREKATETRRLDGTANQSKEMSVFSDRVASLVLHNDHNHSFDNRSFDDDEHREREEEEEEEEEEEVEKDGDGEEEEDDGVGEEEEDDGVGEEEEDDGVGEEEGEDGEEEGASQHNHSMVSSMGGVSAAEDDDIFVRPALPTTPKAAPGKGRRSTLSMESLSSRTSRISIDSAARGARNGAASFNGSFDLGASPKTPFRAAVARNSDLYSTDTPGVHGDAISMMDTEEEEEWADNQDSVLWRGDVPTEEDENEGDAESSQLSIVEEEDADERILAPRKMIKPSDSPGVRRSTRTRMKPVRGWLGEQAQYAKSPTTGDRRLVGVNEVVIREKPFVKTGTADPKMALEARKKTAKQRSIANKKRKEQKEKEMEEKEAEDSD